MNAAGREELRKIERVRFVTENYGQLQGLKWVPLGLYFCFYSLFSIADPFPGNLGGGLFLSGLLLVALAGAGMMWSQRAIGKYYGRKFGRVRHKPSSRRQSLVLVAAICTLLVSSIVSWVLQPPVDLILLSFAVAMFAVYWPDRRFRVHYMVMMPLFAAASFLPLFGVWSTGFWQEPGAAQVFPLFLGLYWMVGGVFDHLLLVRAMKSLPEEGDGGAV